MADARDLLLRVKLEANVDFRHDTLNVLVGDQGGDDYRFEIPLRFVRGLQDALTRVIADRGEIFPLTHTRLVD